MTNRKNLLKLTTLGLVLSAFAVVGVACGGGGASEDDIAELRSDIMELQTQVRGFQALVTQVQPLIDAAAAEQARATAAAQFGTLGPPGGFLQRALAGEFSNTAQEVTIFGPCRDQCEIDYNAVLAQFTQATGIPATYTGSADFETEIGTRIQANQAPDIADFPQPGLLQQFINNGTDVVNVTDYIDEEWIESQYNTGWVELSRLTDTDGDPFIAGVWSRTSAKSYVWYSPDAFEAAEYEIPTTWDELVALTNQIRTDGGTPWCVGIESGAATGWAATDWTEDTLLRTTSLENYDRWTVPESADDRLRFDSPEVRRAITLWNDLWFGADNEYADGGNVRGGRDTVVATNFDADGSNQLFSDPPGCYMLRQASFITGNWIDNLGLVPGEDFDAFYFPPIDEEFGRPFIVSGDLNAAFSDRPEVLALLEFHATPQFLVPFITNGGDLSPFRATRPEDYGSDVQRIAGAILGTSTSARFDGSDLQPGVVGSGSFWNEITAYIAGEQDLDTTVRNIDETWPN